MADLLVFIGDSLTAQFDWQKRFPEYAVKNLGISGELLQGLLKRSGRIGKQVDAPTFIFLMTGINNITLEQYDITQPYREIVEKLTTRYKKTTLVIQSLLPIDLAWAASTVIVGTNRELERIAREYNAEYLDICSLFLDNEGKPKKGLLQDDGIHLTQQGYAVWAKAVEKIIKEKSSVRNI